MILFALSRPNKNKTKQDVVNDYKNERVNIYIIKNKN